MNPTPTDPLFQALANASTADLFWALGEILEPSHGGPFMNSYGGKVIQMKRPKRLKKAA
jgi:hypothetical protein